MSVFGVRGRLLAFASKQWPTAEGTITSTSVRESRSTNSKGRDSTYYHVEISYRFTVDGRSYSGDRVAFGDMGRGDPAYPRAVVKRYPCGMKVTVFYQARPRVQCRPFTA